MSKQDERKLPGYVPNRRQSDRPIIATADSAIDAKLDTTLAGYYEDPFLPYFCRESDIIPQQYPHPRGGGGASTLKHSVSLDSSTSSHQSTTTPSGAATITMSRATSLPQVALQNRRPTQHHHPIIKRGTHARICCMDRAIASFVRLAVERQKDQQRSTGTTVAAQIVVLGAGKDTSFFRYHYGGDGHLFTSPRTDNDTGGAIQWFEVDHSSVMRSKSQCIRHCTLLRDIVKVSPVGESDALVELSSSSSTSTDDDGDENIDTGDGSEVCHLVSHDLRDSPTHLLERLVKNHNFDTTIPTLFAMECVLMYLPEKESRTLLSCLSGSCPNASLVLYDPILSNDPFGCTMEQNLTKAGIANDSLSMMQTRTLLRQMKKLVDCGFCKAIGCDMVSAYDTVITPDQRHRANQSEMLDELEEWWLIMRHYAYVISGTKEGVLSDAFCCPSSSLVGFQRDKCIIQDDL